VEENSKCHLKGILSDMATIVYLQKKKHHIHQFSLAKKIIETQVEPSKIIKKHQKLGSSPT
jgi:hypothetical protein